jgi:hypothetical protein
VQISHLRLRPKRFRVARKPTPVAAQSSVKRGTTIRFSMTAAAQVRFRILRLRPRHGHRRAAGSLSRNLPAGANAVRFSGRIGHRRLAAGRYKLIATAIGGNGQSSNTLSAKFRILPG